MKFHINTKDKTTAAVCISGRVIKGKKYRFRDVHNFHFPLKSMMAAKSGENEIFLLGTGYSCTSQGPISQRDLSLDLDLNLRLWS